MASDQEPSAIPDQESDYRGDEVWFLPTTSVVNIGTCMKCFALVHIEYFERHREAVHKQ